MTSTKISFFKGDRHGRHGHRRATGLRLRFDTFSRLHPIGRSSPPKSHPYPRSQAERLRCETTKRNERKRRKEMRDAEEKKRKDRLEEEKKMAEEEEIHRRVMEKVQSMQRVVWGADTPVHFHELNYDELLLGDILALEQSTGKPLDPQDPAFCELGTTWISDEGVHIGIHKNEVIFVACITSVSTMSAACLAECENAIRIAMDWTTCVNTVRNNASQIHPSLGYLPSTKPCTRHGNMFAMGWHTSFEKGAGIATYAPLSRHQGALETYRSLYPRLPQVANAYRTRLMSLYPIALNEMSETAQRDGIPNFSDKELSNDASQNSYANSLTITRDNFSNFQHRNNDETPHAYGWWWPARLDQEGVYHIDWNSHSKIQGGGFILGAYGIGIDFQRCDGCLVEIEWRGKADFHGTAQSTNEGDFTRFGTSVQITAKGASAARRFWADGGKAERSITYSQRAGT